LLAAALLPTWAAAFPWFTRAREYQIVLAFATD
jgi:hypothetical protein